MKKIIKYVLLDLFRNRIVLVYTLVLGLFSFSVFGLEDNASKGVLSLLNIVLIIVPLMSIVFSTIYAYNSAEFIELLVSQPLRRRTIWTSLFVGLATALSVAFLLGTGIAVLCFQFNATGITLVLVGWLLTIIFTALAMLAVVGTRDKAKGIGVAILLWLFFALLFDGLVLFLLFQFGDYPLEKPMIVLSMLNPVDLSRILVLLKMDISALMGYTGAVFRDFFGAPLGMITSLLVLMLWVTIPFWLSLNRFRKKDL
jgi:Cu-processing system permease protein